MGDGQVYQHSEHREYRYYADGALDTARLYIGGELDCMPIYAREAWSAAQEVRITAAERIAEARALREKAAALRRVAQRYLGEPNDRWG